MNLWGSGNDNDGDGDGDGYPVVLTTDRTLASDYGGSEFVGFAATFPKILPEILYKQLFAPSLPHDSGVMKYGHCGSRKVEASLMNNDNGFSRDDLVIAHPEHLDKVIGPDTEALGITTHDPLGLGPASTTFSSFINGEPYSGVFFKKLVSHPLLKRYGVDVIVGGPGTWQLDDKNIMRKYNVDTIVIGEGESVASDIFERAVNGDKLPKKVRGDVVDAEDIPNIQGPTINGLVEISRGCGRGCKFCNPTLLNLRHRPVENIVEEVKLNCENGNDLVILHAEDVLRYGAKKLVPKPKKVINLMERVGKYTKTIAFSHCSLASAAATPELIRYVSEFRNAGTEENPWFSPQIGIETGSSKLAEKHLKGKAKPFDAEEWPSVVRRSMGILKEHSWVPCTTLIMGLPGETGEDVMKTIELLDDLKNHKFLVVPLMFVPLGVSTEEDYFTIKDMLPEHWQLMAACIKKDLTISKELIEDLSKKDDHSIFKKYGYLLLRRYMKTKMKSYIDIMEQGNNPFCYKE